MRLRLRKEAPPRSGYRSSTGNSDRERSMQYAFYAGFLAIAAVAALTMLGFR